MGLHLYLLGLTSGCVINFDFLTAEGAEGTEKEKRREKFTNC
jgi:hypothetical protein